MSIVGGVFGHAVRTAGQRERMRQWHAEARELALALIARAAEAGLPCPGNDALQGALTCSRPQLYQVLAALEAQGRLVQLQRGGPRTTRVYLVPHIGKATADGAAGLAPKARVHLAPVQPLPSQGAAVSSLLTSGAAAGAERTPAAAPLFQGRTVRQAQPITPARTCQWITAAAPLAFCGCPSVPGRSWCAQHLARVFLQNPHPGPLPHAGEGEGTAAP